MFKYIFSSFLMLAVSTSLIVTADYCSQFTTCQKCVSSPMHDCGWCSYPVFHPATNTSGAHCAGFGPKAQQFICPAIFSTDKCQVGYVCEGGSCQLGQPGQGTTKAECEATCSNHPTPPPPPASKVYGCDPKTKTCNVVPPGTPGASGYKLCIAQCKHIPTHAPAPAAKVYCCNTSAWQCHVCKAGSPGSASEQVCEGLCNSSKVGYTCNSHTGQCTMNTPGTPGGVPLSQCKEACAGNYTTTPLPTLPPNPGPPPELTNQTWRAVEIQNGYEIMEWDLKINHTTVVIVQYHKSGNIVQVGTPYHVANSPVLEFWIMITSGPGTGKYIRTISDTTGEKGPQTTFATLAMSPAGGDRPSSIEDAMTNGVDKVFAMSGCIIGNSFCHFHLPDVGVGLLSSLCQKPQRNNDKRTMMVLNSLQQQQLQQQQPDVASVPWDACSQWATTCSTCIAHAGCGWCSNNVRYSNGKIGNQCAGVHSNVTFVCQGQYSTTGCEIGYSCASGSFKCEPTLPGNGMPLAQCKATCKPTPPPNPRVPQYVCNLTTHQCALCNKDHCPGSMPKGQCAALCSNPRPGPTPDMIGVWRGFWIENSYTIGEVDLVLNMSIGAQLYVDKALLFHANVTSLGADVMLWHMTSGPLAGKSVGVLYQMAQVDYGMYWQGTFALGMPDGGAPEGYNHPMFTPGEKELVLAQCLKAPCKFHAP